MDDFAHEFGGGDELTADALMGMSTAELESLYAEASAPDSVEALDGEPRGIILAVPGLDREPMAGLLGRLARLDGLPWQGKTFRSHDEARGEGKNRFRWLGELAAFETSIGPSALDGAPCVRLNYGVAGNPWPIRAVRDELREVSPGLFFGPGMLEVAGRPRTFLYFAVDLTA
jgi:hypothetical protein